MTHVYDPAPLRAMTPALAEGAAHFDGPGGTQTPLPVAEAIRDLLASAVSNRGRTTPAERHADDAVIAFRSAMADLLGADPGGIVMSRSATQATFDLARTMADGWGPGDEIVVSRLDHDANVRPWVTYAERSGATLRWAAFDPRTGEMPVSAFAEVISERTCVVAVTGASNLIGTRPDIPAIAALVHEVGAHLHVDGVHLTAHAPVDLVALGVDSYVCSPYKFLGPHHGVLAASPEFLGTLRPDKLLPATDAVPERMELGTLPYELLAGTTAAVDVLAGLVQGNGTRRERILRSMGALEAYEDGLHDHLRAGLEAVPGIRLFAHAAHRTPTELFRLGDIDSAEVTRLLAERRVDAPSGNFYALECSRWLGLGDDGGVRVGLAPYSTREDVDRLLAGLQAIAEGTG